MNLTRSKRRKELTAKWKIYFSAYLKRGEKTLRLTIPRYISQRIKPGARKKRGLIAALISAGLICLILYVNLSNEVLTLNISGQPVGYLSEKKVLDGVLKDISTELSTSLGGIEIVADEAALTLEATELKSENINLLSKKELRRTLIDAGIFKSKAWAININGRNITAAATKEEADGIIEAAKNNYRSEGSELVSASFQEEVTITQAAVETNLVMDQEEAVKLLVTGTKEPKTYIVQDGDTIWDIAAANQMSSEELSEANPDINPDRISIGQSLNLYEVKPYLTVMMEEIVTATENIDYETVYESTNTLYQGETKVKTAGVYGIKEVKSKVVKVNSTITEATILDSKVLTEPKSQVALKGTKSLATYSGSGILSRPLNKISVSSAFGSRGGGRHTGVDLRSPKGTPILAALDGVVTFAGYSGSYGNLVKISHGNGLETWYAHGDTINVSVGDKVSKGQKIATVGMTGRTTGYHLHFMVLVNGVTKNPMSYI